MQVRHFLSSLAFYFSVFFCCLNILFFPVPYHIFPNLGNLFEPLTQPVIHWAGANLFGIEEPFTSALVSDSSGMYIFITLVALLSFVASILVSLLSKDGIKQKVSLWFFTLMAYYLALTLFKYGADKIFKSQFYLPEPNTLYTPFGQLTPDIAFWSTMGSSYSYTVFSGIIEIIPALLLLFRKTRLLGILIALAVLTNVVMINFGFDITVKLYSLFLLFITVVLLTPHLETLYHFFIKRQPSTVSDQGFVITSKGSLIGYTVIKTLVIGLVLIESMGVYFANNNLNDDKAPRPPLHGAYDVYLFYDNSQLIPASLSFPGRFKRIFFHRRSYFIVQTMDDRFIDYKAELDYLGKTITLSESGLPAHHGLTSTLAYRFENGELVIFGIFFDSYISLYARKINLSKLPLLSEGFHWTLDDFNR
jgi:hypothetical protein